MSGAIFAVILGASALAAGLLAARARVQARFPIRLAAALLLSLALAYFAAAFAPGLAAAASATALLTSATAPVALVLASLSTLGRAPSRFSAACLLSLAFVAGIAAALTGFAAAAFAPLTLSACAIALMLLRLGRGAGVTQGVVCALAFLPGAFAFMAGGPQFLLFFAGAVLGLTLALTRVSHKPVEQLRDLRQGGVIAR